jgi:Rho family, other
MNTLRGVTYDLHAVADVLSTEQVDNRDSLENVGSKWVAEITEHCQGVKVVLVALKCDLREEHEKEDDNHEASTEAPPKQVIQYQEGLDVARKIGALRYLGEWGCLADTGVN